MNTAVSQPVSEESKVIGEGAARRTFVEAHARRLHEWFAHDGRFVYPGTEPTTRERLWNAQTLLAHGGAREAALADAIIRNTPIDANHFQPIIAVELLLRFDSALGDEARQHLKDTCKAHLINTLEVRFGNAEVNNFSAMTTWYLAASAQALDGYRMDHPFAGIDAIYNAHRLRTIGRNAMRALTAAWSDRCLTREFNSPTYTPITLHALASIVSLIDDEEVARAAHRLEHQLWEETLAFYHPHLDTPCGPFSRAYRVDLLGQNSLMRLLMAALELSQDPPIETLLDDGDDDVVFHHHGDIPFCWAQIAWVSTGTYHLPQGALAPLNEASLPRRLDRCATWSSKGRLDRDPPSIVPVQGDALPGGQGRVVQEQFPLWALGYRTRAAVGQGHPIHLHYALTDPPEPRLQRHTTLATMFHTFTEPMPEFAHDAHGRPVEPDNFNHLGDVRAVPAAHGLIFTARPLTLPDDLPTCELSLNCFIPLHFRPLESATLNGRSWAGETLELRDREVILRVEDHGFDFEITYRWKSGEGVTSLGQWCRFLRFVAHFDPADADACIEGELRIHRTADGRMPSWIA